MRTFQGMFLAALLLTALTGTWDATGVEATTTPVKIFWVDSSIDKVQWRDADGTGPITDCVTAGITQPEGIAVDAANGFVYWSDYSGKIERRPIDCSGTITLVRTTPGGITRGIAVDASNNKIYWARDKFIEKANLDGSGGVTLIHTGLDIRFVKIDPVAQKLYWADAGLGIIRTSDTSGGSVVDIATGLPGVQGIALDTAAGKIYWTDASADKVQRRSLTGTGACATSPVCEDLITTGLSAALGIDLDLGSQWMYWNDQLTVEIERSGMFGGPREDIVTSASGILSPMDVALYIPPAVGGSVELPELADDGTPLAATRDSGSPSEIIVGLAALFIVTLGVMVAWRFRPR